MAEKSSFRGTAAMIMFSVLLSRVLGFFRTVMIPNRMGGFNDITDAYFAAFQIPDLMYGLLVGGAIAASLIPMLTSYVEKGREKEGWRVVGTYVNVMMLVMLVVVILGVVFTPQLMNLIVKGFLDSEPAKMELAVSLARRLMPIAFFMMLSGFCNGIMNSYSRFVVAAFGPCVYNLAVVISIAAFGSSDKSINYGAERIVTGIVICSILYFLLQLSFTVKHLKFYRPTLHMNHPDFKKMIHLALPTLLTSTFIQVNYIVSRGFASYFANGVSALEVSGKTWQMPLGIIAQAVGVAMLPSLSALYAFRKYDELSDKLNSALRFVLFLTVPSAVGLAIISTPVIQMLFNWGELTDESVRLSSVMLTFYSVSVVAQSVVTIMNRAYYSTKNSLLPLLAGSIGIVSNFLLAYLLTRQTEMGVGGIALAYSLASVLIMITLLLLFKRRVPGIKFIDSPGFNYRIAASVILMAIAVLLTDRLAMPAMLGEGILELGKMKQFIWVTVDLTVGVGVYGAAAYALKINEMTQIVNGISGKIKSIVKN